MRIAITVDPYIPVPPRFYGGIERVVDLLIDGLRARGHAVTLFAHPESRTDVELVPYGAPPHVGGRERLTELWQVGSGLWARRRAFDLVHSFGRLAALLPVLRVRRLPKLQSYHRPEVPWTSVMRAVRLAGPSIAFTAPSASVFGARETLGPAAGRWRLVSNGVDLARYRASDRVPAGAPLAFVGRLEPMKGADAAIAIARGAGRRLVIAGTRVESGPDATYFDRSIAPYLDGDRVQYVGPVDDAQKSALLGSSAALLFPSHYQEAFGLVMIEAMACGTPVIGFRNGAVPEVVEEGVTGFVCSSASDAMEAVGRIGRLDRRRVRAECEARFSASAMVAGYERCYEEMADTECAVC